MISLKNNKPKPKNTNEIAIKNIIEGLKIKNKLKINYPMKKYYINVIPLNIFQTWHTKNLPPLMRNNVEYIQKLNPAFKYTLFDDEDCRNFIKENFPNDVLDAFNKLIPGAYKADLWRYCVLYKLGGIYLDIKYRPVNGFKFINLTEKEHWVLDIDNNGIYNALMVCKPGNEILLNAINQIVKNVQIKYYGGSCLDPTGPNLLAKYFNNNTKKQFDLKHSFFENHSNRFIHYKNYIILKSYNGYLQEHSKNQKVEHYSVLWGKKAIYK
jgi:mannosyltransferase OCH1-like enzyme